MTTGRPVRLTDVVAADAAAALVHPSCRPLVRGLLAVLDRAETGVVPDSTRHAWAAVDLVAAVPTDVPLTITATRRRTARLGGSDGIWVDVDVDGPEGAVVRSRHVVAGALRVRPTERATLPAVPRPAAPAPEVGRLVVDAATLAGYRGAAGDTSTAHADAAPEPIVPGLLALWAAIGVAGRAPTSVEARFSAPLPVGATARVVDDGATLGVTVAGRTVLRARVR